MHFCNNDRMDTSYTMTALRRNSHLYPRNRQCECWLLLAKRGIWPRSQTKQAHPDRTTSWPHKEPRTYATGGTCMIHKYRGMNNPRMMVSMATSKTIELLHIPVQSHKLNRQWQLATHNALNRGDPVELENHQIDWTCDGSRVPDTSVYINHSVGHLRVSIKKHFRSTVDV